MNKEQFIKWLQEIPDNFEVFPINASEILEESTPWTRDNTCVGGTYPSVYKKTVYTDMTINLRFKGQMSGEFKRDQFGHEQWTNVRRVNRGGSYE